MHLHASAVRSMVGHALMRGSLRVSNRTLQRAHERSGLAMGGAGLGDFYFRSMFLRVEVAWCRDW